MLKCSATLNWTRSSLPKMAPPGKLFAQECGVCKQEKAKYKCTTCVLPCCSLQCLKKHKEAPCSPPEIVGEGAAKPETPAPKPMKAFLKDQTAIKEGEDQEEQEDEGARIPLTNLVKLADAPNVLKDLKSDRLRELITQIDATEDDLQREALLKQSLLDPEFAGFVDSCLSIVRK